MDLCICPRCALIIPATERCATCGVRTVAFDREHHERLLAVQTARRMHVQLLAWMNQGMLDGPTGQRLIQQLPPRDMVVDEPAPVPAAPAPVAPPSHAEPPPPEVRESKKKKKRHRHDHDEREVPVAAPLLAALAADKLESGPATAPDDATSSEVPYNDADASLTTAQAAAHDATGGDLDAGDADTSHAIGGHGSHRAEATQLGALAALAAVEEADEGGGGSSWIFENIGWFLGATLVLAGSLYGVREAWQALGDVPRHLVVVGALLGYHGGFVGVGALLGRSDQTGSRAAGRVLATIGWLLLPVVAVGLSSLVEARAAIGLVTALGAGALTFWTQRSVAARFAGGSTLAWATLPALASMLPVASFPAGSWPRQLAPLVGLLGLGLAARAGDGWALLAASTASLAAWTFSLTGAPGEPTASLTAGTVAAAATALWVAAFATGLREALVREPIRRPDPPRADALRWIALALVACAVLAAGLGYAAIGSPGGDSELRRPVLLVYLLAAGISAVAFARAHRTSPGALHLLAPTAALTGLLAGSVLSPGPTGGSIGASLAAAALLAWGARERRAAATAWGLGIGLTAVLAGLVAPRTPLAIAPGFIMLVASHATARRWPAMHYAGALFALLLVGPLGSWLGLDSAVPLLLGLGAVYGLVARSVPSPGVSPGDSSTPADSENRLAEAGDDWRASLRPLDDVSLLILLLSVLPLLSAAPLPPWLTVSSPYFWPRAGDLLHELSYQRLALVAAALLGVRAWLDRSALVGAASMLTVSLAVVRTWPLLALTSAPAHLWSALALGLAVTGAALRLAPADDARSAPRRLLAFLPLVRTGRPLADGAGYASVLLYTFGLSEVVSWLTALDEPRRPFFLAAAALLLVTTLVWFVAPTLDRPRARGALVTLAVVGLTGVVLALANRLGRPLSPDVTALRLSIVVVVLYGVSELLGRHGERLGGWLGDVESGRRYHWLATAGLLALTVVLLLDAQHLAIGSLAVLAPPAMFVLGAALGCVLLARRTRQAAFLHAALTLWPLGVALAMAKGSLLGGPYTRLADQSWIAALPTDPWSLVMQLRTEAWQRALFGMTAAGTAMALLTHAGSPVRSVSSWLLDEDDKATADLLPRLLRLWAALTVVVGAVAALWLAGRPASAAMIATGALLALGPWRAVGALLAGTGTVLLLHTQAFASATLPAWTGPALAGLALVVLAALAARKSSDATVQRAHGFATFTLALALLHGLATGAATRPDASLGSLLALAFVPSSAGMLGSPVLALVLAMTALAATIASRQEARASSPSTAALLATLPAPLAALAYALWHLATRLHDVPPSLDPRASLTGLVRFVTPSIGHLTLVTAAAALVAHLATRRLRSSRTDGDGELAGHSLGRDLALLAVLCLASWHVAIESGASLQPPPLTTLQAAAGLILGALVAAHEAWRQQSPRHVYIVQLTVIGLYAVIRSTTARALPPEADAIFALALGFVLLGVTVQARRAKLPPVERATRLFAALLPLGVALTLGDQSLYEQAAGALASALLYGALAWVERSRVLGTLGAVAVNAALLLAALAGGIDGIEVYLAPLGLFLLALGHIFHTTLEPVLRQWLRVLGSLLLYLPAAAITFQLGRATDARYPLAFGAVCLAGVAAGLALRLRAYLLLGSVFLVLDVIANLVHASLRNHRLGFAILSLTGLAVLGGMVLSTLRRDALTRLLTRLRGRLASWE